MSQVIVVTSGKGGVGKTTSSASIATGLALSGYKTVVVDFDIGLRNLDLIFGCENRAVYDIISVIKGEANLSQALIKDKRCHNLFILPASQTNDKDALDFNGVNSIIADLKKQFDYIVCDSPAGIEHGAITAMYHADHAIVVTNPEISSVRDSDRILGLLASKTARAKRNDPIQEHLLITRYDSKRARFGEMLSIDDIAEILAIPLIGIIPESCEILKASNLGIPVIHDKKSPAGKAYKAAINSFLGKNEAESESISSWNIVNKMFLKLSEKVRI